jgi:predicted HicB family RNase H-like nuclease
MTTKTTNSKSETRKLQALVGVRLQPDEHDRARSAAADLGMTLPELLRQALRDRLDQPSAC